MNNQIDFINLLTPMGLRDTDLPKLKKARFISINELNNGLILVLHYPSIDVCTTNRYYATSEPAGIKKQFICKTDNGLGQPVTPGCDHARFEPLKLEDLPENWQQHARLRAAPSVKAKGA